MGEGHIAAVHPPIEHVGIARREFMRPRHGILWQPVGPPLVERPDLALDQLFGAFVGRVVPRRQPVEGVEPRGLPKRRVELGTDVDDALAVFKCGPGDLIDHAGPGDFFHEDHERCAARVGRRMKAAWHPQGERRGEVVVEVHLAHVEAHDLAHEHIGRKQRLALGHHGGWAALTGFVGEVKAGDLTQNADALAQVFRPDRGHGSDVVMAFKGGIEPARGDVGGLGGDGHSQESTD
jgi:hypothetical protein